MYARRISWGNCGKLSLLISVGMAIMKLDSCKFTSALSGACRKRKSERIDKDIKRPKTNEDPSSSEAAFKRARRDSVANAVEKDWDQSLSFNLDEDPSHELWAEAHEKEFEFQKKETKRAHGLSLPRGLTPGV